eukprot:SAG11_NODE_3079_length_2709_cov_1.445594_4_plen_296_part_00
MAHIKDELIELCGGGGSRISCTSGGNTYCQATGLTLDFSNPRAVLSSRGGGYSAAADAMQLIPVEVGCTWARSTPEVHQRASWLPVLRQQPAHDKTVQRGCALGGAVEPRRVLVVQQAKPNLFHQLETWLFAYYSLAVVSVMRVVVVPSCYHPTALIVSVQRGWEEPRPDELEIWLADTNELNPTNKRADGLLLDAWSTLGTLRLTSHWAQSAQGEPGDGGKRVCFKDLTFAIGGHSKIIEGALGHHGLAPPAGCAESAPLRRLIERVTAATVWTNCDTVAQCDRRAVLWVSLNR